MKGLPKFSLLLGGAAVVGGLLYWDSWQTEVDEKKEAAEKRLLKFEPDSVAEIRYRDSKEEGETKRLVMTLKKIDGDWRMEEPLNTDADDEVIGNVLKTLSEYKFQKKVSDNKAEWQKFGISDDSREITLVSSGEGVAPVVVTIGDKSPVGYSVYSKSNGSDAVYIGSQYLETSTAKDLANFREKSVADLDESKISAFTFQKQGDEAIVLTQKDGVFSITAPIQAKAATFEVSGLLSAIDGLRADDFVDPPVDQRLVEAMQPGTASVAVSWELESGEKTTLFFGEHKGALWAAYDPQKLVYKIPDDFRPKINKELFDFRDRRVFDLDASEVARVEMNGVEYEKVEGTWYAAEKKEKVEAATGEREKHAYIGSLLVDLEYVKTQKFIGAEDNRYVATLAKAPQHRITLHFKDDDVKPIVIDAWNTKDQPDLYLVRHSQKDALFMITKGTIDANQKGAEMEVDEVKKTSLKGHDHGHGHTHDDEDAG